MPYGFIGCACKHYLSTVSDGLAAAHRVHSKDPFGGVSGGASPPPTLPARNNYSIAESPDSAMDGGYVTGVDNETNVVVDEGIYNEILQKIHMADAGIAEDLYNIATQIEEMCETIYIVPATLPKYLEILDKVKTSLGEFQSLTEQARMHAMEYVGKIMEIDRR